MIYIGTSGFSYGHWTNGRWYPEGCDLEFYARFFNTVEINTSFYRMPYDAMFESWNRRTPNRFKLVFKVPRFITHMKSLILDEFSVQRWDTLFEKLALVDSGKIGPLLLQLPGRQRVNVNRLSDTLDYVSARGYQIAFECRNETWLNGDLFALLQKHDGAVVVGDWRTCKTTPTYNAPFLYVRRHGPKGQYKDRYKLSQLHELAEQIVEFAAKRKPSYVFFNNDGGAAAPRDATRLNRLVMGDVKNDAK